MAYRDTNKFDPNFTIDITRDEVDQIVRYGVDKKSGDEINIPVLVDISNTVEVSAINNNRTFA